MKTTEAPKISTVPKIPVRRSLSSVTISQRRRVFPSTDTGDFNGKDKIKRSASLGKVNKAWKDDKKVGDKESDCDEVISSSVAHSIPSSEGAQHIDLKSNKNQATQTDTLNSRNDADYDYVYRFGSQITSVCLDFRFTFSATGYLLPCLSNLLETLKIMMKKMTLTMFMKRSFPKKEKLAILTPYSIMDRQIKRRCTG